MRYLSTAGEAPAVSLATALLAGPAPDGGLYVPERIEPLAATVLAALRGASLVESASRLAIHLLGDDLSADVLREIVASSLDFPIPLVPFEDDIAALELFHGPTLAFKDVGARFMARLMVHVLPPEQELTILAATSGDTGSAVAQAFFGLERFHVVVLYPRGQVSKAQQKLFTTLGGNVSSLSVEGTFDDCQRLVRQAFADEDLRRRRPLASANSINVGRLLPQIFYYFHAVAQLAEPGANEERPLIIATPSGNFGNLTAGLFAKRLGLPCRRFVAATNANDVGVRYLASGDYTPRPSERTLSNAMDVGDPSNLRRVRYLYGDQIEALRRDLVGFAASDEETVETIRDVHERCGYTLDPHTAVGYRGLRRALSAEPGGYGIVLATAHPAKFADAVTAATGAPMALPPTLAERLDLPEQIRAVSSRYSELRDVLLRATVAS